MTTAKTTNGYTQKAKQGISWKGVVDTVMQSPLGRAGVKVAGMIVGGLTKTQQKAVSQAQKVWNEVSTSTSETVKILNKKLGQACSAFLANAREKGKTKEDIINEVVQYAIEAEDFGPLVDSEWEEYYDEDTLAEIKKRLQMYYLEHPEEHERIWEKYYKQDQRTWPEKGLILLELLGFGFSLYSGVGLVSSVSGAIGGGVGGTLALAGGGTVSGAASVAVFDLLVGAVGVVGSIAGGEAIVHGFSDMAGNSSGGELQEFYNSIKDAPNYPDGFKATKNGTEYKSRFIISRVSLEQYLT